MTEQKYRGQIKPCGEPALHPAHVIGGYPTVRYGALDDICPGQRVEEYAWTVTPGQAVYYEPGDPHFPATIIVQTQPTRLKTTFGPAFEAPVIEVSR